MTEPKTLSEHRAFGGVQGYYEHASKEIGLPMRFGLYRPPQAQSGKVPLLVYLAGLECNEQTFSIKAGAQRFAAEHGIALLTPDTSPRGAGAPGEDDSWDFGTGAGFYLDATEPAFAKHYRMYSYVVSELPELCGEHFAVQADRQSIFGHSMGGHGALVCALRNPKRYCSVSAFAPVAAPTRCPWGQKAFSGYLGQDRATWKAYDASELVQTRQLPDEILIDQGTADRFLETQLSPDVFEAACQAAGQALKIRFHPGYDHSYFFIASFIQDHLAHHAKRLLA